MTGLVSSWVVAVICFASVAFAASTSEQRAAEAAKNITLSSDLATAIFAGLFLLSLLIFGIKMLDGIQTSDKIGTNKPELTQ